MVVICGSATSWIIENMLDTSGDLAARGTEPVFLEPFSLAETKAYFDDRGLGWDEVTLLETQMVFGGLPFFFSLMHPHASLLGYSTSQIAKVVDEAAKCGYVLQYRNNGATGHPKYLMLIDPFILFHYRFIEPTQRDAPRRWSDFVADQGRFNAWRGNAFEIVCLYHIRQLKAALGISGVETRKYPWTSMRKEGGAQVDLIIERADRVTNLCEMKFTDEPFELARKMSAKDLFREPY